MKKSNKLKIFNDPIYGFITIPNSLIFDLIEHPYFQRLRRISQMGLSYMVYPGAHHTRFHHALGSMHLMQKAVNVLRFKGVEINSKEEKALYTAILLHDIGHGPFSHAMEHSIVKNVSHEQISLKFMQSLDENFNGNLTMAIQIFQGVYPRRFMCQLISSQIDMDRSDYLKRDSFYTGVSEGNVNSERLITMLNVRNDELVVEEKGIYSIEKFLVARRFMYWQVYLHKTSLVAEQLIVKVLKRAKDLISNNTKLPASSALTYFLENTITLENFDESKLELFARLDDYDLIMALKQWQNHDDFVLCTLSKMIINRDLLKIKFKSKPIKKESLDSKLKAFQKLNNLTLEESEYFVFEGNISNQAYQHRKEEIMILKKSGKVVPINKVSEQFDFNISSLSKETVKYYICYPKEIH
ncbi:HD domain-containing protein [Aegicerativicinus sediminis]|uniref:HD domain-containing protein n=1 Tax=Aegicerativicinus sediminis TaxID=2893202 RepID=UPI001E38448E|nr:HD domain-containing protein [Aegicerativicinus sediminis]